MAKRPKRRQSSNPGTPIDQRSSDSTEMLRSEEQLRVGTQVRVSGRAVLRKYVVTETVTQTFQARREEVRLEHEPAAGENPGPATDRTPFDDGVAVEMVLYREVPKVEMEVVAVERIRLHTDTVSAPVQISENVRQEQLVVEPPDHQLRR
jgi:stress response protein YsnF